MLLLVHINPKLIWKVQLTSAPESLEHLYNELQERLEGDFCLQYEDPDFGQAVCNLIDIAELPKEKAVLYILWNSIGSPSTPLSQVLSCSFSISSFDTAGMSSPVPTPSLSSVTRSCWRSISQWPKPFPIPMFSYHVELKLCKGNEVYAKDGKGLQVTRDMKMEILDKLAQRIFAVKAYPDKCESVASELNKYPCLKEPGTGSGYAGWTTSIKYKLGNFRSKLCQAGCNEVNVNKRGRGDDTAGFL